ncbi:60S acidic ribosomal protein P2-4 [Capsicum baccatum]|uniref:60S acidic ribosomal protein P2-4 n=1 Tax=Capsicum baccatum TaxID=33114 RepID=A0A2G2VYE9_CAPBA|nr:60S acidic ribosomal protein P2-4 [Capsicum baccatum]
MRDLLWLDPESIVDGQGLSPRSADLKKILGSVGADDDRIKLLLSQVKGKDITELIVSDREKLASVPAGDGGAVAVAAPTDGAAVTPAAEEKKELKRNLMKTRKRMKRRGI